MIDVVVVYKVDRLTRSLIDFAKIVERFDAKGVSFVSVTQAFNTTTSMGRLTLNVLLSFAQFEREVTAERIRDKIAASKAKGMWMGGAVPLGYSAVDRKLMIHEAEAETVRGFFRRYLQLGSVRDLQAALEQDGARSRLRTNGQGRVTGGAVFTRGALYHLLSNPAYRGTIRHKEKLYPGAHPPIIDEALWDAVQTRLASNGIAKPAAPLTASDVLLKGLLYDDRGNAMTVSHTSKGSSRYRYYVSMALQSGQREEAGSVPRVSVAALDQAVEAGLTPLLSDGWARNATFAQQLRSGVRRVVLEANHVRIEADPKAICKEASDNAPRDQTGQLVVMTLPVRFKRRQGTIIIETPGATSSPGRMDRALVRAVVLARRWAKLLEDGVVGSTKELARQNGLCEHYTARLMPLAYLAPDLTAAILEGRQPAALSLKVLTQAPLPLGWAEQRRRFGHAI